MGIVIVIRIAMNQGNTATRMEKPKFITLKIKLLKMYTPQLLVNLIRIFKLRCVLD